MAKVRALQAGYDNVARREVDEVFEWPETLKVGDKVVDNPVPEWAEKVAEEAPKGKQQGKNLA